MAGFSKQYSYPLKKIIMTKRTIMAGLLIGSIVISSCGTGKKLEAANADIQQLQTTNTQLQATIDQMTTKQKDLQNQVANLIEGNKSVNEEFSKYRAGCEDAKVKLAAVQAVLTEEYNTLQAVEKRLVEALADFEGKGVEVYEKDRVIYINMEDKLLYKSGSAVLGDEGKKALAAVASALNDYPKLKVMVVGHTDDKKFKNANSDNLSLSTERANGVVRVLRDSYKVDPARLTSAGKGKYTPLADNTTEEGRAKNRRTEIILNPDLVKAWQEAQK
jgi:chemotaxis protein MotB